MFDEKSSLCLKTVKPTCSITPHANHRGADGGFYECKDRVRVTKTTTVRFSNCQAKKRSPFSCRYYLGRT